MNDIGSRIREHRRRKGWSQEQLGAECAFSQPKISKMENGACDSLSDLKVVAKALGVGIEELIYPSPPHEAADASTETENG